MGVVVRGGAAAGGGACRQERGEKGRGQERTEERGGAASEAKTVGDVLKRGGATCGGVVVRGGATGGACPGF